MKRGDYVILTMFGVLGCLLGKAVLWMQQDREVKLSVSGSSVERSLLTHSRRVSPKQGVEHTVARQAYHVPEFQIEDTIDEYIKNGWWDGVKILFERWALLDPEAAFSRQQSITWPGMVAEKRYSENSMGVMAIAAESKVKSAILEAWFDQNPQRAMDVILSLPQRGGVSLERAIELYASHEPAASYRLMNEHLHLKSSVEVGNYMYRGGDESSLSNLFEHWSKLDPVEAATRALDFQERSLLGAALAGVYEGWAQKDADAADEWAASLSDGLPTDSIRKHQVERLAETDPLQAVSLSLRHQDPRGAKRAIEEWIERDGVGVLKSVELADHPEDRRLLSVYGVELLAGQMLGADLGAAVLRLPSDVQQEALGMLAGHWKEDEPEAARAFAVRIQDPILRRTYLATLDR